MTYNWCKIQKNCEAEFVTNGFYSLELEVIEGNKKFSSEEKLLLTFFASSLFPMHILLHLTSFSPTLNVHLSILYTTIFKGIFIVIYYGCSISICLPYVSIHPNCKTCSHPFEVFWVLLKLFLHSYIRRSYFLFFKHHLIDSL